MSSRGGGGRGCQQQQGCSTRVGKYELGRTVGEGTFAKVKFARNVETGEHVAIKILNKDKLLKHKMIAQIKREISTMTLIKHPNVISMYEVMASKTKIYIVLDFVTGGELFDKVASSGRLKEDEARKYFQQLIHAVDYCHSRGVSHRDLKPENLLLDSNGLLKVTDFGLSALPQQIRDDGLLHTTCGTPNYVAPEVINNKGYDGTKADLWSCGVILFVLMAGYLPFEDSNLLSLYRKIFKADFSCPPWFSASAKKLIKRILDPDPTTRITIAEVMKTDWFKKGYQPPIFEASDVSLDDMYSAFDESMEPSNLIVERRENKPVAMNAFELICTSQGLNLGSLFEKQMGLSKRETRFASSLPANQLISKMEEAAKPLGFAVEKKNYKLKLQGEQLGRKGHLTIATEIFEVAPSLNMVEFRKSQGDTLEYETVYNEIYNSLKDIAWPAEEASGSDKAISVENITHIATSVGHRERYQMVLAVDGKRRRRRLVQPVVRENGPDIWKDQEINNTRSPKAKIERAYGSLKTKRKRRRKDEPFAAYWISPAGALVRNHLAISFFCSSLSSGSSGCSSCAIRDRSIDLLFFSSRGRRKTGGGLRVL